MEIALVTIKTPRNKDHNPQCKLSGECPTGFTHNGWCSDVTGEHHTIATKETDANVIKSRFKGFHITRIELVELD